MQKIPFELVKPGMVLGKDVLRPALDNPVPICVQGTSLTDVLIKRLRDLGVQSVIVEGHPVIIEGEATLEEKLEKLDRRFHRVQHDSTMQKIKEMFQQYLIRSMET